MVRSDDGTQRFDCNRKKTVLYVEGWVLQASFAYPQASSMSDECTRRCIGPYMDTGGVPGVEFAGDHEIMVSPSEDLQSLRSRPGGSLVLGCPMSGGIRYNVINWKVSAGSSTDCLHFAESILIRHLATLALMWRSVT